MNPTTALQPGQSCELTEKLILPVVQPHCTDPAYQIQDSDLTQAHTSLFPPERVTIQRLLNHGRHVIAQHAGKTLIVIHTRHLKPISA